MKNKNLNLIVSDQASYMLKAIENLKKAELYPNLNHITCLCHALNRVCEVIRIEHPEINEMISSIKKVLLKSNKRKINFCKETQLTLPPDVIVTRWSSWLKAAFYYGNNFDKIKQFIKNLKDKTKAIASAKNLMESTDLQSKLLNLMQYTFLPRAIERLESKGLKFDEQISIVEEVKTKLNGFTLVKLEKSLKKNPDIYKFRDAKTTSFSHRVKTTFAPCVFVDVERSFSIYKNILKDNRIRFTEENIEKYNVIYYNSYLDIN